MANAYRFPHFDASSMKKIFLESNTHIMDKNESEKDLRVLELRMYSLMRR